jgi:hypothetical protein
VPWFTPITVIVFLLSALGFSASCQEQHPQTSSLWTQCELQSHWLADGTIQRLHTAIKGHCFLVLTLRADCSAAQVLAAAQRSQQHPALLLSSSALLSIIPLFCTCAEHVQMALMQTPHSRQLNLSGRRSQAAAQMLALAAVAAAAGAVSAGLSSGTLCMLWPWLMPAGHMPSSCWASS